MVETEQTKEYADLAKDYQDCSSYIRNIDFYNYGELYNWALIKYSNWVEKYVECALPNIANSIPPKDIREKAMNSLNNLLVTLKRIAAKNVDFN